MTTRISVTLPVTKAKKAHRRARALGFESTGAYVRFLLEEDTEARNGVEVFSENEIVQRMKETEKLYKEGKLIKAESLAAFLC